MSILMYAQFGMQRFHVIAQFNATELALSGSLINGITQTCLPPDIM